MQRGDFGQTKGNCTFRDASLDAMRLQVELEGEDGQKYSYEKQCDRRGYPKSSTYLAHWQGTIKSTTASSFSMRLLLY